MDLALLGASASLSAYLPRFVFENSTASEHSSTAVAIGLSLCLFSLTILEASPGSWLLLLSPYVKDEDPWKLGFFTISRAYFLLLWSLSLAIIVAFPCIAGLSAAQTFGCLFQSTSNGVNESERKDFSCATRYWRASPWWIRFIAGFVKIIFKNFWRVLKNFFLGRGSSEPTLVMTVNDEDLRPSNSSLNLEAKMRSQVASPRNVVPAKNAYLMTIGSICGVSVVLVLVSSLGPIVVRTSTDDSALAVLVSWLCAVGLMISSLMNGFGSVSLPYTCLAGLYLKPIPKDVITKQEGEIRSVQAALEEKKASLREMTVEITFKTTPTNSKTAHSQNTRAFAGLGDELVNRRQQLKTETEFLETLCKDMKEELEELRVSQRQAAAARTAMGGIKSYVGLVFSVVLLVRLASAGLHIWQSYSRKVTRHKVAEGDFVTTVLLWLTGHHYLSPQDRAMISQIVSLALTAILSFTQMRTFLRTVAAVHRRMLRFYQKFYCIPACAKNGSTESSDAADNTPSISSQFIAGTTGCYCLSCIVLIKMMLPEEFCEGFSAALGGMDIFTIHTAVVDTVFTCSAAVSAAVFAMLFGIQRQNVMRHTANSRDKIVRGPEAC